MAPRIPSDSDRVCGTIGEWDPAEISQESFGAEWTRYRGLKKSRISTSRDLPKAVPVFRGRASATRQLTDEVRTSEQLASSCFGAWDAVPRSLSRSAGQIKSLDPSSSSARALAGSAGLRDVRATRSRRLRPNWIISDIGRLLPGSDGDTSPTGGFTLAGDESSADRSVSKWIHVYPRAADRGIRRSKARLLSRCLKGAHYSRQLVGLHPVQWWLERIGRGRVIWP
jgi:hypothetical protein